MDSCTERPRQLDQQAPRRRRSARRQEGRLLHCPHRGAAAVVLWLCFSAALQSQALRGAHYINCRFCMMAAATPADNCMSCTANPPPPADLGSSPP